MSPTLVGLAVLGLMMVLALRADRRLAPGRAMLPMNFAPDGTVIRHAPRRIALWFMPALGVVVFVPLALFRTRHARRAHRRNGASVGPALFFIG